MKETVAKLKERFECGEESAPRDGLIFIEVRAASASDAMRWLRDSAGYGHLVMISVVDRIEEGLFQLTYILHRYSDGTDIGLSVKIPREKPVMESVHTLWAVAKTYQREIKEMYGIDFPGSPDVDMPMILEGWDDIPVMRRDFDTLKYARETFYRREGRSTRDPAEEMEEKRYPLEGRVKREIKDLSRKRYKEGGGDEQGR